MKSIEHYLSLNYPISIHKDDEGDFIAEVQELSGCVADGATPNEAFENIREAMRSWIGSRLEAGLEVPEPRTEQEFSGKVLLRMPRSLHRRLSQRARVENSSLNQYIVSLLAERCGTTQAVYAVPAWGSPLLNTGVAITAGQFFTNEGTFMTQNDVWGRACSQFPETCYSAVPIRSAKGGKTLPESVRSPMVA